MSNRENSGEQDGRRTYQWEDVEHLLNDLRADGYEVVDVQTNTSEPDDSKLLMIAVGRND